MVNNSALYRLPTLYPTPVEAHRALILGLDILKGDLLKKDAEGFATLDDLCKVIKEKDPSFGYMNRNHIIELFFRDIDRRILISGVEKIRYKNVKHVKPPSILYFGTISNLIQRMKDNGLKSKTKGYIKLYETPEDACLFAQKFARPGEKTAAIKINAELAFSDGLKFSTFEEGEYIVVQILGKYIL